MEDSKFEGLFTLAFREQYLTRLHYAWLAGKLYDHEFEKIDKQVISRVVRDMSGVAKAGSVFDTSLRF